MPKGMGFQSSIILNRFIVTVRYANNEYVKIEATHQIIVTKTGIKIVSTQ